MIAPPRSARHEPRGRRVLVTGAAGFIGRHLCRVLSALGAEVHGTTRNAASEPLPGVYRLWHCEPSEPADVECVLSDCRPDAVVHLAAHVSGDRSIELAPQMLISNLAASVYLMDAAARHGVSRFVNAGSLEEPSSDEVPSSPYAASKAAASLYARYYDARSALEVMSLRVGMGYGPGQRDASKLVPHVVGELLAGRLPQVTSGIRSADWTYIDDIVDAFVTALAVPVATSAPLPVGTGRATTVRTVVEMLGALHGTDVEAAFGRRDDRSMEPANIADTARTEAALGWRARVPLDEGLARTFEWYAAGHPSGPVDVTAGRGSDGAPIRPEPARTRSPHQAVGDSAPSRASGASEAVAPARSRCVPGTTVTPVASSK